MASFWIGFALVLQASSSKPSETPKSRFQVVAPLRDLPPITIDALSDFIGPAKRQASIHNLQGRMLWIDATANIERYNSEPKIIDLVRKIKQVGFNTVVLDVKPLSGQTIYPSAFAPKLTEWRGKQLPAEFDPVPIFSREARAAGLSLFVSMNAFCDGHRLVNVGPGFEREDEQSVVYEADPVVRVGVRTFAVATKPGSDAIFVVDKSRLLPDSAADGFFVTLRSNGEVIDGFKLGEQTPSNVPMPKGGVILYGEGEAATWLQANAVPGARVEMDSSARFVPLGKSADKQYPLMTSPTHPRVRERLINLAKEVVGKYDIDGLIYDDRLRYTGLNGDFSPTTMAAFEAKVGRKLTWPDDVYRVTYSWNLNRGIKPGPFYERWMSWRAGVLRQFAVEARAAIRRMKPTAQLGVYAGSWYGEYQSYGNNWAAPSLEAGFWFLTPEYARSGMAPVLDLLVTGCYYNYATIHEALGAGKPIGPTIEAAGVLSYRAARDTSWVYAGISLMDFKDNPDGLGNALQAAVASSNGVMVFDLSHDIEPMWPVFAKAFRFPKEAPTKRPELLQIARKEREMFDKSGRKEPPIIISAGSAGIGF